MGEGPPSHGSVAKEVGAAVSGGSACEETSVVEDGGAGGVDSEGSVAVALEATQLHKTSGSHRMSKR